MTQIGDNKLSEILKCKKVWTDKTSCLYVSFGTFHVIVDKKAAKNMKENITFSHNFLYNLTKAHM